MIQLIKVGHTANYTAKLRIKLTTLDDPFIYYVVGNGNDILINFFKNESCDILVFDQEYSTFYIQKSHIQWIEVVQKEDHDKWVETRRYR